MSFDRRRFLAASGGLLLAACGSSSTSSGSSSGGSNSDSAGSSGNAPADGYTLVPRFARELVVPGNIRMPFSLASDQALLSEGPQQLTGRIVDAEGATILSDITAAQRRVSDGIVYWDFHITLDTIGIYTLFVDGGTNEGTAISVNDPADVPVPSPAQPLPPFDTPTTSDSRGVNPICTRIEGGPCPFHALTLTEALATGKPVAYLIGTPAHCQFGTCAPGLEFLINASKRLGDQLAVVHAEVYTDDKATVAAPAVDAYNLQFEPVLFLADATGTIVARLDGAWNQSELDETLDALVA